MNAFARLILVSLFIVILPCDAQDEAPSSNTPSRDLLNLAFTQLKTGKDGWGSDDFGSTLKKITSDYPDSPEAKTANTMLVPYLMQKGNHDDALNLANSVISDQPTTWQSAFAMLNKVSILQSQGKTTESMEAAMDAIPAIDATSLHSVKDPDFTSFLRASGIRRSGIKDGILGLAANQLIQEGRAEDAAPFLDKIRDPKIKAQLSGTPAAAAVTAATDAAGTAATATAAANGGTTPSASGTTSFGTPGQ